MNKVLNILFLLITAASVCAQEMPNDMPAGSTLCEITKKALKAPYYYCDCKEDALDFKFPLETQITDTIWFKATVDDLKQGISAYWFANTSVTMEVYAMCTSKTPTLSITIGKNQMHDVDVSTINKKLDEMGSLAELAGLLEPRIRVYPNGEGEGKVYCYPYNQGPESTCDEPLPLRPNMTYVCDMPYNAYQLDYSLIPSSAKAFVHWKQAKNKPSEIWFTLDSCNGAEVARTLLSDSLHIFTLDSAMLKQTKKEKRNLWMHVQQGKDLTGRVRLYTNPKFAEPATPINDTTCLGKTLTVNGEVFMADTAFVDTFWVKKDTLQTMQVALHFTEPELEYDTVYVREADMKRGYRYQPSGTILYSFEDTIVEITKDKTCTRWVQVTPEKLICAGMEETPWQSQPRKQIQNGQLIIVIDEQKYTVLGQQIK